LTITFDEFQIGPHALSLLFAYLLALPIGWNREREERSAGLRTFPLVAVASCGFIQGAESFIGNEPEALARIIEGIITGVGFIGGGAILQQQNSVRGTATAASLWVTGAIGVSVGVGSYDVALMLTIIAFLTLQILSPLSRKLSPDSETLDDTRNSTTLAKQSMQKSNKE
jgi:putative Mg2+ transporter-C (MgtC) family protein